MLAYDIQENFLKTVDQTLIKHKKHELQFDFWKSESESEIERLVREMAEVKASTTKVRKGLYAENGSLKKRVLDLEERLAIIERNIFNGL